MLSATRRAIQLLEAHRVLLGAKQVKFSQLEGEFVRNIVVDGFVCRLVELNGQKFYARITRV